MENLLAGAGADELIDLVMRLFLDPGDVVLNCPPTFGMYLFDTSVNAARVLNVPRRADFSLDIDALDMSLIPGCVSAEPDGMSYRDLRDTLFVVAEHAEVVGFDLVEVNPQLDIGTGITSYLAAHTIVEFLGRICDQPRWAAAREERRQA